MANIDRCAGGRERKGRGVEKLRVEFSASMMTRCVKFSRRGEGGLFLFLSPSLIFFSFFRSHFTHLSLPTSHLFFFFFFFFFFHPPQPPYPSHHQHPKTPPCITTPQHQKENNHKTQNKASDNLCEFQRFLKKRKERCKMLQQGVSRRGDFSGSLEGGGGGVLLGLISTVV